jgi:hypothetical protein
VKDMAKEKQEALADTASEAPAAVEKTKKKSK